MTDLIVVPQAAHWQRLKRLVLDSVSSPITRRVRAGTAQCSNFVFRFSHGPLKVHQVLLRLLDWLTVENGC